ncbi:hypothetical protein EDB81DRAFT_935118 [Dactylonectria macrodidyma]|uniref:Polyketide synthase n=1 Tax=Dactylonectria macrodidyma TaxID=307937 RepID=A0A9P9EP08_9HYPO|nr:hypothetical protein EDB81DRAFT_935118 [Dactylonectria macrodidyma]
MGSESAAHSSGLDEEPTLKPMPIAIVGMSCRFGGDATSPAKLWELCATGKDSWSPIPAERFTGRNVVAGGYFLQEDVALFDAPFFNLPSDVASAMDPQVKLLLESVYEATEDAGIPIEKLAGSNTSVFSGCFFQDYHDLLLRDSETLPASFMAGNGTAMLSNRISHFYDLKGPSMTVDTGCSSGMVALHQACQNIRARESEIAIVGGASVILHPDLVASMHDSRVLGADGKCYAWDSRAHGYGRGEGVATLILKPLDSAIRDGDRIHSVILDTGLNQDGKTTTITSPSADAQQQLIKECYKRASLDLSDTAYVEAHMTGTATGDPIEAEAIAKTFGNSRSHDDPVIVGSVKTNIGHTEPVSGLAAVIKTAFVLKKEQIPANLNYETTNPAIPLVDWKLRVASTLRDWPSDKPLRASVNNFGFGGTNGHAIMQGPPKAPAQSKTTENTMKTPGHDRPLLFVISAKDSTVCQNMASNMSDHISQSLEAGNPPSITDLAYSLAERRSRLPWVKAVQATTLEELATRLEDSNPKPSHSTRRPRLGFVFNGQGAQWYAMGRELIQIYPVFSSAIGEADQVLKGYGATWSLHDELLRDEESTRVHETNISQPINVALQLCLVNLLKSWNITPSAVTSHSSGEIAAAYSVGILSFKEALGVVYYRGELALKYQKLSSLDGGMLAAGLGAEDAERYLEDTAGGRVVVACINSPESVTLSGDLPALREVSSRLKEDGIFARELKVPLAYHSHHMLHMAQEYKECLERVLTDTREDKVLAKHIIASPVTGEIVTSPETFGPEHWVRNLTSPVLFYQAFENMCFGQDTMVSKTTSVDMIVEIGAHSTLSGPIRSITKGRKLPYASCLKRSVDAVKTMQDLGCELLRHGYPVALNAVNLQSTQDKPAFVYDLPSYPWNHTKPYWTEPRVSRKHRFRKLRAQELIGTPVAGANASTFCWRNFLRVADIAWLADHRINSKVILPGAGYITMAIEAIRLLTDDSEQSIGGYRLREVDIINALAIPDSVAGVETQLCLRPCSEKEIDHKGWYEFEIWSLASGDSWTQHCNGQVSVTKATAAALTKGPESKTSFFNGSKTEVVEIESIFAGLREMSFYHGPKFQNLTDCRTSGNKAVTDFDVSPAASGTEDYVLHPTTLDSIIQATYAGVSSDALQGCMVVPRAIRNMFVPKNLNRQSGEKLQAFAELLKSDRRGCTSTISVVNQGSEGDASACLQIDDFYAQAIPREFDNNAASKEPVMCSKSRWELDILHDFPEAIKDSMRHDVDPQEIEFDNNLDQASYHYIQDALHHLEGQSAEERQWYHRILVDWMKAIVAQAASGELAPGSQNWSKTSKGMKMLLFDELEARNAVGALLCRVGRNLVNIVRGEVTPLELMMEGNLLNEYYMEIPRFKLRSSHHLARIAELYAVKRPGARVLEIGGGTGGATGVVLESFASRGEGSETLLGHYDFTDISSGFFEAARQKFSAWTSLMDFKKLNIEVDPAEQGFAPDSYDLIVASAVLHATKNLRKTMSHVRKLLKPGGKLLLAEATQDRLDVQLIFGTLPGWWLSEEPYRKMSPNVSLDTWDRVLREEGFTGVDLNVGDYEESEYQSLNIIVTTAKPLASYPSSISIVYTSPLPQEWVGELKEAVHNLTGTVPDVESLAEARVEDKLCIFTGEMDGPFIHTMDSVAFDQMRNLLVNSRGILWLSASSIIDVKEPLFAQTQGLLRTLRKEDSTKRCVQLDFELDGDPWTAGKIRHIVRTVEENFDYSVDISEGEWEYAVKDDMLHVSRIYPDRAMDQAARKAVVDAPAELQPFHQPGRALVWEASKSNLLSDLHFTDRPDIEEAVPSGVVEVEPKAFGLNFRDVMAALGQIDESLMGHDCSGIVTRLGPNTEQSGLNVGDRVTAMCDGRFSSTERALWTAVAKIPDDMSWEEAASIPIVYTTAYHSLFDLARLQKGESILIHAATGGVGQAAIMLAQHLEAEIYVTCSTPAKRRLLEERFNIHPDHIFNSRDTSFAPALMTKTRGRGVDVVLNSLSGLLLKASWECVARFGRFIEIGKVDIEAGRRLDMAAFGRGASIFGVDLLQLNRYKGSLVHKALTASVKLCADKIARPIYPRTIYPISDMEGALRQMQAGTHLGRLILVPHLGDQVKVVTRPRAVNLGSSASTYLITGGLGGLGRAIALWMVQKGARNILLVSRNAQSHPDAASLMEQAKNEGCNLQVRNCDVSDEQSLLALLDECARAMPPIRGVVAGAMVLNDSILERMTYAQWRQTTLPKVAGTMNLHKHLPNQSFFIMLSSFAGAFGHLSQANYNAGNTFQDALARHRASLGMPAVAIDLAAIKSAGFVAEAEDAERERILKSLGADVLEIDHVLRIIESAIREPLRACPDDSQIITCVARYGSIIEGSASKRDRRFATVRMADRTATSDGLAAGETADATTLLIKSLSSSGISLVDAVQAITQAITSKLADIFNIAVAEIDASLPMSHYGVDSLVAVELRNWLGSAAKAKVSIFTILQTSSLNEFAALVASNSDFLKTEL